MVGGLLLKGPLAGAIPTFGASLKPKLASAVTGGAPENQLRGPLDKLMRELAESCGLPGGVVHLIGETTLKDLKTRPDYAATIHGALVGFIEVKAPGKGADPRRFGAPVTAMRPMPCQNPIGFRPAGNPPRFMPKAPVMSVMGRTIVMTMEGMRFAASAGI